jgi:hypothetical protein
MSQSNLTTVVQNGVGLGTVLAVVISWSRNRSLLWAIFHGVCSWLYVIYYAVTDSQQNAESRLPGARHPV